MELVYFLLLGAAAGWLAGVLVRGGGYGLLGDIVVGVLGAVVGGYLFGAFGVSAGGGLLGSLIVATVGAVVLIVVLRLVSKV